MELPNPEAITKKIMSGARLTRAEAEAEIRKVQDEMHGFVTRAGAASLVAHRLGIGLDTDHRDLGRITEEASPIQPKIESVESCSTESKEKKELAKMKASDIYPPRFLNAEYTGLKALWGKELVIASLDAQEFLREGKTTKKIVLRFEGLPELALNKTNANKLIEAFGDDTAGWVGKKLMLVKVKVPFQGKQVDAISVEAVL